VVVVVVDVEVVLSFGRVAKLKCSFSRRALSAGQTSTNTISKNPTLYTFGSASYTLPNPTSSREPHLNTPVHVRADDHHNQDTQSLSIFQHGRIKVCMITFIVGYRPELTAQTQTGTAGVA
jgi:hypothetical protein